MPIPAGFDFSGATVLATLSTSITVNGTTHAIELPGARGCPEDNAVATPPDGAAHGAGAPGGGAEPNVVSVPGGIAVFASDNTPLGKIRVFTDPRVSVNGRLTFATDAGGNLVAPATSSFHQVMVFHITLPTGEEHWLYGGDTWEVTASVNAFPPVNTAYSHAAASTPLYDLRTGAPNVATKGPSTISLSRVATAEEKSAQLAVYDAEVALFNTLSPIMAAPDVAAADL